MGKAGRRVRKEERKDAKKKNWKGHRKKDIEENREDGVSQIVRKAVIKEQRRIGIKPRFFKKSEIKGQSSERIDHGRIFPKELEVGRERDIREKAKVV